MTAENFSLYPDSDRDYVERLEPPDTAEAKDLEQFKKRQAQRKKSEKDILAVLKKLTRKFEQGEDLFEGEIIAEQQTEEVQAR